MIEKYEIVLVLNSDLEESAVKAEIGKVSDVISSHKGEVQKEDIWGKRQLSYQIENRDYGIYLLLLFTAERKVIIELERQLKLNDAVLRHIIVKKDKFAPDGRPTDNEESAESAAPAGVKGAPAGEGAGTRA